MRTTSNTNSTLKTRIEDSMPLGAIEISSLLVESGISTQLVGGCIRDMAIGRTPHDWDFAVSCPIGACVSVLSAAGVRIEPTGLGHGTVTAIMDDGSYEITEYRGGDGCDATLMEDLAHRDFTMNAIAYDISSGEIIDPSGGLHDIEMKTVRAVGDAGDRFAEDGLRVLRAARQAAELGFSIEYGTSRAMHESCGGIAAASVERQAAELRRLLVSDSWRLRQILLEYPDVIAAAIPEIAPCIGFPQHTKWHCYDVYRHMVEVCCGVSPDFRLRLAALLHDIGKPSSEIYKDGRQHFYGHQGSSATIADGICTRLRLDNATRRDVMNLVRHHDDMAYPVTERNVRRLLLRLGSRGMFGMWYEIRRADILAHSEEAWHSESRGVECCDAAMSLYAELDGKGLTASVRELDIDGNDLMSVGYRQGPEIGNELRRLLGLITDGEIENERETLIEQAKRDFDGMDNADCNGNV